MSAGGAEARRAAPAAPEAAAPPARKAPDAFRTISEVSEELDIPAHVLRFWETKFPQLSPLKRGGRRRYYRPADIELLRGIRALLYDEGLTIKGLQKVFRERGARYVVAIGAGETPEQGELPAAPEQGVAGVIARLEAVRDRLREGPRLAT